MSLQICAPGFFSKYVEKSLFISSGICGSCVLSLGIYHVLLIYCAALPFFIYTVTDLCEDLLVFSLHFILFCFIALFAFYIILLENFTFSTGIYVPAAAGLSAAHPCCESLVPSHPKGSLLD